MKKLWVLLLSVCIGLGTLVAQDINTLMERAQKGNAHDQWNLGVMYDLGTGGFPQDSVQAVKWYRLAADQGNADAQRLLGHLALLPFLDATCLDRVLFKAQVTSADV